MKGGESEREKYFEFYFTIDNNQTMNVKNILIIKIIDIWYHL